MPQTPEAQAFLARIKQLPPGPDVTELLTQALQPSLDDEAVLRKLWATDKNNAHLRDIHAGLVDVFDAPDDIRRTHARVMTDEADLTANYILPLSDKRRRKDGEPSMVATLDEFKKNWALFTEGSLSQLTDWSNVVAAGGSVQACLAPVPESAKESKRAMRKYFHNNAFPTSDVDLFLYGLTPEQAQAKMQTIYEAVRDSVPWDVTCVRTKHTVSIHSQYPYRSVQIVLRLYSSPAEILAGFDVDAPCCAFDGERVWANPRAIVAMMRQCNTVDMTRRSPSYEVRLAKYSMRDFEVYVPTLKRDDIDPTIFERSIQRVQGLARLIVLERLVDPDMRQRYLFDRRKLRARPDTTVAYNRRKKNFKGDMKANIDIGGIEMNDYDVQSLHIPYGPGWDARRIDKLVYQTDLGMNSPYNPKNKDRRLHRHPAFFGTLAECLDDCCEFCLVPKDDEEKELQEKEDGSYVRGRVQFLQEDPGRQSISGSFNPIDEGEWAEQAYIKTTEKLFNAIVAEDREAVVRIVSEEGFDNIDRRDHVGRTPLQMSILCKAVDIACVLIDAGARMTARLVDGRTALHLAAQLDLPVVVRKLLERSAVNDEKAKKNEEAAKLAAEKKDEDKMEVDDEVEEDEDNEEEEEDEDNEEEEEEKEDGKRKKAGPDAQKPKESVGQIPEDEDAPDVFDVDLPDWDYAFTPLQFAVVFGSLGAIDELLAGGADPKIVTKVKNNYQAKPFHPLTLTLLTRDANVAVEVAKKLFAGGATSSQADDDVFTLFHRIVCGGKAEVVDAFLRNDPNAKAVIDTPHVANRLMRSVVTYPVVSTIARSSNTSLAILLAHGAKITYSEEDCSRALDLIPSKKNTGYFVSIDDWKSQLHWPVEAALAHRSNALELLLDLGADINLSIRTTEAKPRMSVLDAVRQLIVRILQDLQDAEKKREWDGDEQMFKELAEMPGWKGVHGRRLLKYGEEGKAALSIHAETGSVRMILGAGEGLLKERCKGLRASLEYFIKAEELLVARGAKTWKELYPDALGIIDDDTFFRPTIFGYNRSKNQKTNVVFHRLVSAWQFDAVPTHLVARYEDLFEACYKADNAKIEALCLPKNGKSDGELLQIAVRYGEDWGVTPLSLALDRRHWATARLILAIAVAQYKPADGKPPKFSVSKLALEDDDSDHSSDEDSDMEDAEPPEINFVDIAQRPSEVQTDASPERLLQLKHRYQDPKTKLKVYGCVLFKAVIDDDFEAFVQIADLYKCLPKPLGLSASTSTWVFNYDRPTILDELIRRTGTGIELPEKTTHHEGDEKDAQKKPPPKTYLGLNVHGKKRKDLVQMSDPNAPTDSVGKDEFPLLWTAAHMGAVECVRYFSTERALEAYQYYAATHSDSKARYLRSIDSQIARRLGWSSNQLKESAVTAAITGNSLETLKAIVEVQPAELQGTLMERILYAGFNHILVAANWGCTPEMFDYLLSKGVSPTETDVRGWNMLHILCKHNTLNHLKLLRHVLKSLPEDIIVSMLLQQSKKGFNTPLHLSVKKMGLDAVRLLMQAHPPAQLFLLRDGDGAIPLHRAVHYRLPEITRLIGDAGPPEAFAQEDGVGNTPLEIAISNWLQAVTRERFSGDLPNVLFFCRQMSALTQVPCGVSSGDVRELRDTIGKLAELGHLRTGTTLATALAAFMDKMEAAAKEKESEAGKHEDDSGGGGSGNDEERVFTNVMEGQDAVKTMDYVAGAVGKKVLVVRTPVHLSDVHRSVNSSLGRSSGKTGYTVRNKKANEGLEPEKVEEKDENLKERSALARWHKPMLNSFNIFDEDNA